MTAHKHAEMIEAKADDMDLVVFAENINTGEWWECSLDFPFNSQQNFFLCLPQHKEACLHWLNGGKVEVRSKMPCGNPFGDWFDYLDVNDQDQTWLKTSHFMSRWLEIRLKPKKEKRWIIAKPSALASMIYFHSKQAAENAVETSTGEFKGQIIEIEVEV